MKIRPAPNDNIRIVYQLAAQSIPEVGRLALTVADKEIFADLVDANRRKLAFLKLCDEHVGERQWTIEIRELNLHD